ncbi:hypothetical protein BDV96DRAFT_318979 [Lophiotrema nucula]|uniref:Uncharacterized protein n=1 Tax=Lophiotrema nucula TaxID=690887 RepID=A0A6A5ZPH7_9PLEO|nr:hypothetical protein BDV96DRAFT_318979 [Lophiotrema nucula]
MPLNALCALHSSGTYSLLHPAIYQSLRLHAPDTDAAVAGRAGSPPWMFLFQSPQIGPALAVNDRHAHAARSPSQLAWVLRVPPLSPVPVQPFVSFVFNGFISALLEGLLHNSRHWKKPVNVFLSAMFMRRPCPFLVVTAHPDKRPWRTRLTTLWQDRKPGSEEQLVWGSDAMRPMGRCGCNMTAAPS